MILFFGSNTESKVSSRIHPFNSHWNIIIGENIKSYKTIPSKLDNNELSEVIYEKAIPSYLRSGDSILFFTTHQSVKVYIGHRLIYLFTAEGYTNSKTPGNGWHIIGLEREYVGRDLKIVVKPSYKSVSDKTLNILYGNAESLLEYVLKSNLVSVFLCVVLFAVGILNILVSIIFKGKLEVSKSIIWIGLFSVMISIWSISDLDLLPLFTRRYLLNNQITYISLKLIYIPVVTYMGIVYDAKDNKLFDVLIGIGMVDFFATILLQLFGIADFKETIILYHTLLIVSIFIIIFANIKELILGKGNLKNTVKVHLISITFMAAFVGVDLGIYYVLDKTDNGFFTKTGIVGYIIILLYIAVNKSINLIRSDEQLDRMRQIASMDAITQLSNRTAFQEDINSILQEDYNGYGIAVFDLNELKEFNDLYGHSAGDYYIIISSEVLQDVFGQYGTVYRIGGDEFCAIMKDASKMVFRALEDNMNKRIEGLNGVYFSKHMSIAAGYAVYNPKYDISLNDTFHRADKKMYIDKKLKKGTEVK